MTTRIQRLLTALFSAGLAALLGLSVTVHAGTGSGGGVTVSGTDEDGGAVSFSSDDVIFTLESETAAPLLSGPTEMPALEGDEIFFHYFPFPNNLTTQKIAIEFFRALDIGYAV